MTSGAIEGWNFILKESDHKQQRLRPDVFLSSVIDKSLFNFKIVYSKMTSGAIVILKESDND